MIESLVSDSRPEAAITDSKPTPVDVEKSPSLNPNRQGNLADPKIPSPGAPPNGGLEAWLVVMGGFCIGVFQDYYQTHQLASYSPSTVAWIPSTESFMMFFWGPVAGISSDNYGPRLPILLGSSLHVFGSMMTSLSSSYYQIFLAQGVCSAIGCSFLFFPTIAAVAPWFSNHRALALGIVVSGSSIGGVILPIMVSHLIPRIGFGWAMRTTGFFVLGILVLGNIAIKSRLPPPRRKFKVKEFLEPFTEKTFVLFTASSFFIYLGGFLPYNFIIAQARAGGMSPELVEYLVPIINAASTFGRIVPAHLGDGK